MLDSTNKIHHIETAFSYNMKALYCQMVDARGKCFAAIQESPRVYKWMYISYGSTASGNSHIVTECSNGISIGFTFLVSIS